MKHRALLASLAAIATLSACASQPAEPALAIVETVVEQPLHRDGQLIFDLGSGEYACEMGQRVNIDRVTHGANRIRVGWNGGDYDLDRDPSFSGLPRFEDATSGLVWIDLPWKGVLLDGKTQKPLANECKGA